MDRIESPRHYPDNDLVEITHAAVWVDAISGYGTRSVAADEIETLASDVPPPVRVDEATIDNGRVRVSLTGSGEISLEDRATGRRLDGLLSIEDRVDRGDLYTPSIRETASTPEFAGVRVMHRGPLIGALELRWRLVAVATELRGRVNATLRVTLRLEAGAPFLRIRVRGSNRANDHRLRIGMRTDVSGDVWADAAFGPVERRSIIATESERRMETPPPTAPLHRYVSVFDGERGATLFSDGLAEYEAGNDARLLITLVRAVGELSRNDLPERPGHAGWPVPTPAAQSRGPFAAELALMLHGGRTVPVIDAIERAADDVLLPLHGMTIRDALSLFAPTRGAELRGPGLAFSAMKPADDGDAIVVRCVNLLDEAVDGSWTFGFPISTAHRARLDETVIEELVVEGRTVSFRAEPRAVVTVLVSS
jgi:alpha-mannosidase